MNFKKQLTMQLVPQQAHGRNLRSILKKETWNNLSRAIRDRDKLCVHCDNPSEHCHEVWEWIISEGKLVQRLVGLEGVCKDCHDFMHFGRVMVCDGPKRMSAVFNHAAPLVEHGRSLNSYISDCISALPIIYMFPLGKIDLSWLHKIDFADAWSEILDYLSDEPDSVCIETMKENHAEEPE